MKTIIQTANELMLAKTRCIMLMRDGSKRRCDKILKTGVTYVGTNTGSITISRDGKEEDIPIDCISAISEVKKNS
jgi:hypothetical protein